MNVAAAIAVFAILIGIVIGIPVAIFFGIKHLIKFSAKTVYEEKAKAEEKHRQNYDSEGDR